jgi:hypothetical protein
MIFMAQDEESAIWELDSFVEKWGEKFSITIKQ